MSGNQPNSHIPANFYPQYFYYPQMDLCSHLVSSNNQMLGSTFSETQHEQLPEYNQYAFNIPSPFNTLCPIPFDFSAQKSSLQVPYLHPKMEQLPPGYRSSVATEFFSAKQEGTEGIMEAQKQGIASQPVKLEESVLTDIKIQDTHSSSNRKETENRICHLPTLESLSNSYLPSCPNLSIPDRKSETTDSLIKKAKTKLKRQRICKSHLKPLPAVSAQKNDSSSESEDSLYIRRPKRIRKSKKQGKVLGKNGPKPEKD